MSRFLEAMERRFGGLAIPNLTLFLMVGQILVYGLAMIGQLDLSRLLLVPQLVLAGEIWRVVTFIFMPPLAHPIFMAFAWYLFYIMGTALEHHWGAFRYNLFLGIGFLATVAAAFAVPGSVATNVFIGGSVFLAFAFLNPNFELLLFFILPVKIKWFALLTWVGYGASLLFGSWSTRLMVLASLANFLAFFGRDVVHAVRSHRRRAAFHAQKEAEAKEPFHRCHTCGITDQTDPDMEFRYCSSCDGDYAYCEKHLRNHEHVKKEKEG